MPRSRNKKKISSYAHMYFKGKYNMEGGFLFIQALKILSLGNKEGIQMLSFFLRKGSFLSNFFSLSKINMIKVIRLIKGHFGMMENVIFMKQKKNIFILGRESLSYIGNMSKIFKFVVLLSSVKMGNVKYSTLFTGERNIT